MKINTNKIISLFKMIVKIKRLYLTNENKIHR